MNVEDLPYNLADLVIFSQRRCIHSSLKHTIVNEYAIQHPRIDFEKLKWEISPPSARFDVDFAGLKAIVERRYNDLYKIEMNDDPDFDNKNTLVIHLRLGDRLAKLNTNDFYKSIIDRNGLSRLTNCHIVWGIHNKDIPQGCTSKAFDESRKAVESLEKFLRDSYNYNTRIVSRTVDQDFCKLSTSEHLITGDRGFAWLAASINPNNVYWDVQDLDERAIYPKFGWLNERWINNNRTLDDIIRQHNLLLTGYNYHINNKKKIT